MKQFGKALPLTLLISYLAFNFTKQPQISDSIIIIALCALSAFKIWNDQKQQPDYKKQFEEEISDLKNQINKLEQDYGQLTLVHKKASNGQRIRF